MMETCALESRSSPSIYSVVLRASITAKVTSVNCVMMDARGSSRGPNSYRCATVQRKGQARERAFIAMDEGPITFVNREHGTRSSLAVDETNCTIHLLPAIALHAPLPER